MKLRDRAKQLTGNLPVLRAALRDPETPPIAKLCASITVAYALSPIDLIPDFIPLLGYLDDVILLPALIALTIRLIPRPVWARSRALCHREHPKAPPETP